MVILMLAYLLTCLREYEHVQHCSATVQKY